MYHVFQIVQLHEFFLLLTSPDKIFKDKNKSFKNLLGHISQEKVDFFFFCHLFWSKRRYKFSENVPAICWFGTHVIPQMIGHIQLPRCSSMKPLFLLSVSLALCFSNQTLIIYGRLEKQLTFFLPPITLLKLQINFHNIALQFLWDCDSIYLECSNERREECRPAPSRGPCWVWTCSYLCETKSCVFIFP